MWGVLLGGGESDLNDLKDQLANEPSLKVVTMREQWCLSGPEIDSSPDAVTALQRVRGLFSFVLLSAMLDDGRPRVVTVLNQVIDGESTSAIFIREAAGIPPTAGQMTVTVTDANGNPRPARRKRTHCEVMLDLPVSEVGEVAMLLAGDRSPVDLYKVFEIIRFQMGGRDFAKCGWASKSEQDRFTSSVNNPGALGTEARHARLKAAPPKNPRTIAQAQSFIEEQVRKWVSALAIKYEVPLTDP